MPIYQIQFTRTAKKELDALSDGMADRIVAAIGRLEQDTRGAGTKKLKAFGGRWRLQVGDFRVVYLINDEGRVIIISIIQHRRDVYRDL